MTIRSRAAGLALLLTLGFSSAASAALGYATGDVNLRAGPSTDYPVVVTLQAGEPVEIFGCLSGYSWCDVDWNGYRGWVSALYLESVYESRRVEIYEVAPPIIGFTFGTYWDDYYRDRPFYRYRDRYDRYDYYDYDRRDRRASRRDRREARQELRQERRQAVRQERRQDRRQAVRQERRREARQERRQERRQAVRQGRRQDRRQAVRQERRQERRQAARQERRQERRQAARQERRQERRASRRGGRQDCRRAGACN